MGFLNKLFGGGDPLDPVRRASRNKSWADVLARGESLSDKDLSPESRRELECLLAEAGDALGALNLSEAEACLRAADVPRAAEHLQLAAGQARSEELLERIRTARAGLVPAASTSRETPAAAPSSSSCCPSGCSPGECGPSGADETLDEATRMELILTSYPAQWAARYQGLRGELRDAVLLAHEGMEQEARALFEQVPARERDDLYHFEFGALLARIGEAQAGCQELQKALSLNPDHLLAEETLIDMNLSAGRVAEAEERLRTLLAREQVQDFCHARLAGIEAGRGRLDAALEHGRQALALGNDPQVVVLTASLLEKAGKLEEAEATLARFPAGGCGGQNIPLAEFWARHGKNPDKALAGLHAALRQEPDNPRWLFRIAQVYLCRGRRKEAAPLLMKVLENVPLESELGREAKSLLETGHLRPSP